MLQQFGNDFRVRGGSIDGNIPTGVCFDDAILAKVVWRPVEIDKCAGNIGGHDVRHVVTKWKIDFGRLFVAILYNVVGNDTSK
jgi:hypothetical protein